MNCWTWYYHGDALTKWPRATLQELELYELWQFTIPKSTTAALAVCKDMITPSRALISSPWSSLAPLLPDAQLRDASGVIPGSVGAIVGAYKSTTARLINLI